MWITFKCCNDNSLLVVFIHSFLFIYFLKSPQLIKLVTLCVYSACWQLETNLVKRITALQQHDFNVIKCSKHFASCMWYLSLLLCIKFSPQLFCWAQLLCFFLVYPAEYLTATIPLHSSHFASRCITWNPREPEQLRCRSAGICGHQKWSAD